MNIAEKLKELEKLEEKQLEIRSLKIDIYSEIENYCKQHNLKSEQFFSNNGKIYRVVITPRDDSVSVLFPKEVDVIETDETKTPKKNNVNSKSRKSRYKKNTTE